VHNQVRNGCITTAVKIWKQQSHNSILELQLRGRKSEKIESILKTEEARKKAETVMKASGKESVKTLAIL